MEAEGERKMALALLLACPACTGGFLIGIGTALGATAAALRGFAALAIVAIVAGLWAQNAWNRRNEDSACELTTPTRATGARVSLPSAHAPDVRSTPTK